MYKLVNIIRLNNATFYDYRTNKRQNLWCRVTITAICALLISVFLGGAVSPLIISIITVQSILIGFSFSVMFFILSSDFSIFESESIEDDIKLQKLRKLSNELFYNLSYFVVVSIASLIACLILLIPSVQKNPYLLEFIGKDALDEFGSPIMIFSISFKSLLLFFLLEGAYTFIRLLVRVNYLFEQKLLSRSQ